MKILSSQKINCDIFSSYRDKSFAVNVISITAKFVFPIWNLNWYLQNILPILQYRNKTSPLMKLYLLRNTEEDFSVNETSINVKYSPYIQRQTFAVNVVSVTANIEFPYRAKPFVVNDIWITARCAFVLCTVTYLPNFISL